jgi:hypothetical protein
MATDDNVHPRIQIGLEADKPATPGEDGLLYSSEQFFSVWRQADASGAGAWQLLPVLSTGGAGSLQFGSFTLTAGEKTISNLNITTNSKIFISLKQRAGTITAAPLYDQSAITVGAGTGSFHIASVSITGATNASDVSGLNYLIID